MEQKESVFSDDLLNALRDIKNTQGQGMKNQWKPKNSIIIEEPEMAFDESLSEDHAFGLGENYELYQV